MTDQPGTAVATRPDRSYEIVQNVQPMLDTARFEHFQRAAKALMHSSILNPSIRGSSPEQCFSNLMLIFDLSDRWKLPAMSIAQGVAIVHDKVVYEGKLIAAMLDASLGVRLHYFYQGQRGADDYRVYVSDRPWEDLSDDELEALKPGAQIRGWRIVDGSVAEWRTYGKENGNGPRKVNGAWVGAATQNQLAYRGSREWARRFEPAQMLGVYGDDEIDAITLRMEARDVTPAAPGLTGGFTRPAEAEAMEIIGEVVEVTPEPEKAPETPQETQEPAGGAKGRAKAKPPAGDDGSAPDGDSKRQAVLDERKAALETAQKMGEAAHDAAAWGNDDLEGLLKTCKTDEQRTYVSNGYATGRAALEAEKEEAYQLGRQGTPMMRPDWFNDGDKSAERRWGLIHDEWKRGAAEGTAEAQADARVDEPDAVDADLEGEAGDPPTSTGGVLDADAGPDSSASATTASDDTLADPSGPKASDEDEGDAIDAWIRHLAGLGDWKAIKSSMNALAKTDAWDAATPERIADVRRRAWLREAEIISAGDERMDFINDLTAFRCWIETTDDPDAVQGNWMTLVRQSIYLNLGDEQKKSLEAAVLKRLGQIQGGN